MQSDFLTMYNWLEIYFAQIEQKSYRQNRKAIDGTKKAVDRRKWLLIEQKGYRQKQTRKAIDRTEKLSIEQKSYRQNRKAIDRTETLETKENGY